VRQILLNLLSRRRFPQVARCACWAADGRRGRIAVIDTGIGIARGSIKLFKEFMQVDVASRL
jgi:hypothetical protein